MVDSKYYKNLYKDKAAEEEKYSKNYKELKTIYQCLVDKQDDEINRLNSSYSNLKGTLANAVRHNYQMDGIVRTVSARHENDPYYERKLSTAIYAIDDEMRQLQNKQNSAKSAKEDYQRKYKEKKEQENQEFWDSFWNK